MVNFNGVKLFRHLRVVGVGYVTGINGTIQPNRVRVIVLVLRVRRQPMKAIVVAKALQVRMVLSDSAF